MVLFSSLEYDIWKKVYILINFNKLMFLGTISKRKFKHITFIYVS